jgi:hypothetical protein
MRLLSTKKKVGCAGTRNLLPKILLHPCFEFVEILSGPSPAPFILYSLLDKDLEPDSTCRSLPMSISKGELTATFWIPLTS